MAPFRIVARLDVKPPNLVKGIQLEGFRVLGAPADFARRYALLGVDEIFAQDVVASLYGRPSQFSLISQIATDCFVPLTVAGGIRSVEDAVLVVGSGADKAGINTAAVADSRLFSEVADELGRQAMVAVVEAKRNSPNSWEVYTEGGRERSGISVRDWVIEAEKMGAGEIVVVSIDADGSQRGIDLELAREVRSQVEIPVLYQGGISTPAQVVDLARSGLQGAVIGAAFHYGRIEPKELKQELLEHNVEVRL